MKDLKMYEISDEIRDILQEAFEAEGEITEDNYERLEQLQMGFKEKASNIVKYIKMLEYQAENLKEEAERLSKKRKTAENAVKGVKFYLKSNMTKLGQTKIDCGIAKISICRSKPLVIVFDEEKIPDNYKTREILVKIDKTLISADLNLGNKVEGAELQENTYVRIS